MRVQPVSAFQDWGQLQLPSRGDKYALRLAASRLSKMWISKRNIPYYNINNNNNDNKDVENLRSHGNS
jgi:hypothetical protein